jgi:hypothetical protein
MITEEPTPPTSSSAVERSLADPAQWRALCGLLVGVGATMALVGAVVGIRMATRRTLIPCPDGYESTSPDPNCYAHHHAGQGTAIALISGMLLVLILLVGLAVAALPALRRVDRDQHPGVH